MSDLRLGIDLGGTKTLATVFDSEHRALVTKRIATRREEGADAVLDRVAALARQLVRECGGVASVGVGFAGLIDPATGVVDSSVILPGFEGVGLSDRLARALGVEVAADNDATAAGLGELVALGTPADLHMVVLTLGTGIGGAIVIEGRLFRGASNTSAEFGNTTIDWRGASCVSGNRGSLNTWASGTGIVRRARELQREYPDTAIAEEADPLDVERIAATAASGDALARRVLDDGARALGAAIANLLNIFNPNRVALMGGLCRVPGFIETARAEAMTRAFGLNARAAVIEEAVRGDLTGVLGASCLLEERRR